MARWSKKCVELALCIRQHLANYLLLFLLTICLPDESAGRLTEHLAKHVGESGRAVVAEFQCGLGNGTAGQQPGNSRHQAGLLAPYAKGEPGLLTKQAVEGALTAM